MNDNDLLALAARAHGDLEYVEDMGWIHALPDGTRGAWWHPLTDDGDALRTAVKLGIEIGYGIGCTTWRVWCGGTESFVTIGKAEHYETDSYTATRLAIVRAAAAIGKGMP
jgi:hypothetical protein